MIEQKIICDGCENEIKRYSPTPTYSHVNCNPVEYVHNNMIHAVYITPEPAQQYCRECWIKMKKAVQPPREVGITEYRDVKLPDAKATFWNDGNR